MSIEDIKEKPEVHKRAFECKHENTYEVEIYNSMTRIHDNKLNNIAEFNLLHDIINTTKRTKLLNSHYSPIIHGCMNNRKGKAKFKKF